MRTIIILINLLLLFFLNALQTVTSVTSATLPIGPEGAPPPSSHHQPLELPFYPLSESHIRTHLLPYPVRCCWAEPTGPCLSLLWLLPLLLLLLLPPQSSVRGQLANGTGFRKGEREKKKGKKKNRQTRRRGEAPSVYCAIQVRRAAGAEWLLLVFIGAY